MNKRKIKLIPIKELEQPYIDYYPDYNFLQPRFNSAFPECCNNCPNNPANGGSGMCCCAIPYLTNSNITYTYANYTIN